jgi:hypothetical protein
MARPRSDLLVNENRLIVEEKTLVVQEGMERALGSHRLWTVIYDCNISANKSNQPIHNLLLFVTEPRTSDYIYIYLRSEAHIDITVKSELEHKSEANQWNRRYYNIIKVYS